LQANQRHAAFLAERGRRPFPMRLLAQQGMQARSGLTPAGEHKIAALQQLRFLLK
jgi:hypothetical protein